ncbi:MAG: Panacea domain-containing protein [Phycisphaerae bacterium]
MRRAFRYNAEKTAQAVALLLQRPGRDHRAYLKVLKLLYLAERESFLETGAPITGDKMVSMDHGPALSATYDLMKGESSHPVWSRCFRPTGDHELDVISDPGKDLLCPYEAEKLCQVADRYADKDRWETKNETHSLPEWEDPLGSSKIILLKTILRTENKEGRTGRILREGRARQAFVDAVRG